MSIAHQISNPRVPTKLPPFNCLDLPASWTLIECIAWIMLRDPKLVQGAARETAPEGGQFWQQYTLPGGSRVMANQIDERQCGVFKLDLLWSRKSQAEPLALGCGRQDATKELLVALRTRPLECNRTPMGWQPCGDATKRLARC